MSVALDQGETLCVVRLEGEINIASAAALKAALLEALALETELRIDLERATEVDLTALQLLWAAQRQALQSGKSMTMSESLAEPVVLAAREVAFEEFPLTVAPKVVRHKYFSATE